VSTFMHACEGDAVTKLTNEKVPYFNAPIYLQNKTQIGKVDEIFGPINESVSSSPPPPTPLILDLEESNLFLASGFVEFR
jgi:H/ACA ribonucleoprotein complex subunit 1